MDNLISQPTYDHNGDEVNKYHLELQYEASSNILVSLAEQKEYTGGKTLSTKRIEAAYQSIVSFIKENTERDNDELKRFFMYFLRNLKFIQISTPDINDALKIFETINERGAGLNPMDLLKNLIFRQIERSQFDRLKDRWQQL